MSPPDARAVFILSPRQRDELAAAATRAGWQPIAARRADALAQRVAGSAAPVVVVDARGAVAEVLEALREEGAALAAQGRAILALTARGDDAALIDLHAAGATHFLTGAMRDGEFGAALLYAARYADRLAGGWEREAGARAPLGWRYDPPGRSLQLTRELARYLGVAEAGGVARVLRALPAGMRRAIAPALRRVVGEGQAAVAHDAGGLGRVVQHLHRDAATGRIRAQIESLVEAPDVGGAARGLFAGRTRSIAALARDLPDGIARGEIEAWFQPQVRIADGRVIGVEALARWRHPRLGDVGAEPLLAAAARGGLSGELSAAIHRRALGAVAAWPVALSTLRVSINVTAADLADAEFAPRLLALIDESGVARGRVTVEVTESELIETLEAAAGRLATLRAAGCATAIDDFGTGYSSLAYLAALPLDYLKLDRALTTAITAPGRDRVIVRGVIAMARALGLGTIAEGVETEAQAAMLAAEGCDTYQGFLCSPPLADADFVAAYAGAPSNR